MKNNLKLIQAIATAAISVVIMVLILFTPLFSINTQAELSEKEGEYIYRVIDKAEAYESEGATAEQKKEIQKKYGEMSRKLEVASLPAEYAYLLDVEYENYEKEYEAAILKVEAEELKNAETEKGKMEEKMASLYSAIILANDAINETHSDDYRKALIEARTVARTELSNLLEKYGDKLTVEKKVGYKISYSVFDMIIKVSDITATANLITLEKNYDSKLESIDRIKMHENMTESDYDNLARLTRELDEIRVELSDSEKYVSRVTEAGVEFNAYINSLSSGSKTISDNKKYEAEEEYEMRMGIAKTSLAGIGKGVMLIVGLAILGLAFLVCLICFIISLIKILTSIGKKEKLVKNLSTTFCSALSAVPLLFTGLFCLAASGGMVKLAAGSIVILVLSFVTAVANGVLTRLFNKLGKEESGVMNFMQGGSLLVAILAVVIMVLAISNGATYYMASGAMIHHLYPSSSTIYSVANVAIIMLDIVVGLMLGATFIEAMKGIAAIAPKYGKQNKKAKAELKVSNASMQLTPVAGIMSIILSVVIIALFASVSYIFVGMIVAAVLAIVMIVLQIVAKKMIFKACPSIDIPKMKGLLNLAYATPETEVTEPVAEDVAVEAEDVPAEAEEKVEDDTKE